MLSVFKISVEMGPLAGTLVEALANKMSVCEFGERFIFF